MDDKVKAVIDELRAIGEDCQRGAFGANLAERLWDVADKFAKEHEAAIERLEEEHHYATIEQAEIDSMRDD